MRISSPALADGGWIPAEYTADGANEVLPLEFEDLPAGTESLALVVHDPDVPRDRRPDGNFDHWVVWDIPAGQQGITGPGGHGGTVGVTTIGTNAWVGPAPPPGGGPHRYYFTVYAVDSRLALPSTAGRADLEHALERHILGRAVLMGRYQRD